MGGAGLALGLQILILILMGTGAGVGASETEKSLLDTLFKSYNKNVRPAQTADEKVTVRVGMTLSQLISLNEKNEEMTTNVFMNMAWTDYRLRWNPEQYDGIDVLRIPSSKVWLPDIVLLNKSVSPSLLPPIPVCVSVRGFGNVYPLCVCVCVSLSLPVPLRAR
ncbi:acetylcholine receptor subunit beta [Heptranchias perlo]|uniref:acetylcholine receptor subunit beta n=1 Tax=Heptranchias perlo TaxID=212740 RepID=UPI00355A9745